MTPGNREKPLALMHERLSGVLLGFACGQRTSGDTRAVIRTISGRAIQTNLIVYPEVRPQPPHCDYNSYFVYDHLLSSVDEIIKHQLVVRQHFFLTGYCVRISVLKLGTNNVTRPVLGAPSLRG
jgi:hypothetical protein